MQESTQSENMSIIEVLISKISGDPGIVHLLKCLHFVIRKIMHHLMIPFHRTISNYSLFAPPKYLHHLTEVSQELWNLIIEERPQWLL